MEKNHEEEFRKIMNEMTEKLKSQGINVSGSFISSNLPVEGKEGDAIGESLKKAFGKDNVFDSGVIKLNSKAKERLEGFVKKIIETNKALNEKNKNKNTSETKKEDLKTEQNAGEDFNEDELCLCGNCLNYENFESVLSKYPGGVFNYSCFKVGNKEFNVKYWEHVKKGIEKMIIKDVEHIDSVEELKKQLDKAISNKDYGMIAKLSAELAEKQNKKLN